MTYFSTPLVYIYGNLAYVDAVKSCQRGRKSGKDALLLIYEGILTPTRFGPKNALAGFLCDF